MAYGKGKGKGKGKGNKVCKTDGGHRPASPLLKSSIAAFKHVIIWMANFCCVKQAVASSCNTMLNGLRCFLRKSSSKEGAKKGGEKRRRRQSSDGNVGLATATRALKAAKDKCVPTGKGKTRGKSTRKKK